MKTTRKTYKLGHSWTKDELKRFLDLWDNTSSIEMAERFGVSKQTISAVAAKFRKAGYPLVQKRKNGILNLLIKEVIREAK
jgi:transposase